MTLTEIFFNYSKAIRQAEQLDTIAKKLQSEANNTMGGILQNVKSAWQSDSAAQYLSKGSKVKSDILTTAGNLRAVADTIRKIARQIRDAELAAWRIANERKQ